MLELIAVLISISAKSRALLWPTPLYVRVFLYNCAHAYFCWCFDTLICKRSGPELLLYVHFFIREF